MTLNISNFALDQNNSLSVHPAANTPIGGVALINGTPTIISYTTPADGQQHMVTVGASELTTVTMVGGAVTLNYTLNGQAFSATVFSGALGVGNRTFTASFLADPGTTVSVSQNALTSGAASVFIGISTS